MKTSHRLAATAIRQARRFLTLAAERAAQAESSRKRGPSFRALTDAETETLLGVDFLAALSARWRRT